MGATAMMIINTSHFEIIESRTHNIGITVGILAAFIEMVQRNFPVIVHPTKENLRTIAETAGIGAGTVMPLTSAESIETILTQSLTQKRMVFGNRSTQILQMVQAADYGR